MSRLTLLAAISAVSASTALVLSAPAVAQVSTETDSKPDVVVTASRIEQPVAKTLASVTVIDRKAIERAQVTTLPELLQRQAGIQYITNGSRGSNSSLFMRGTNGGHALVLVDGVRVGSATLGTASLENYTLDQIDRIEIVRGPRSSLYGSEAIGGVIQIFTKKSGDPLRLSVAAGSKGTVDHSLSFAGANERTRHSVTLSYEESQGFDSSTQDNALADGQYNYDKDGYRNKGADLSFSHRLTDRLSVEGMYLNNRGKVEFDPGAYGPDSAPFTDFDNTVASLSANLDMDLFEVKTQVSRADDKNETNASRSNFINTTKNQGLLQVGINNDTAGALVTGLEYVDELVDSSEVYTLTQRAVFSGFAQWQKDVNGIALQMGARHDDNEQFGSKKTHNVGLGMPLGKNAQIYTTFGKAFKAPTFNDLYWPADSYSAGNPNLVPETSSTGEIGTKWFGSAQTVDVSVYKTDVKHLIQWQPDENYFYSPTNLNKVKIKGIDASYGYAGKQWSVNSQLSLLSARDAETDEKLIRRAGRTLTNNFDYDFSPFSVGATWYVSGPRDDMGYDEMGNSYRIVLGGYSTLDLRAAYQATKEIKLKTSITNVFDKEYVLADGYNTAGLGGMLTLLYVPK